MGRVAHRANFPLVVVVRVHQIGQIGDGANRPRLAQLLVAERVAQPFQNVAGGLDAAVDVRSRRRGRGTRRCSGCRRGSAGGTRTAGTSCTNSAARAYSPSSGSPRRTRAFTVRLRLDSRCVPPQAAPRIGWASSSRINRGKSHSQPLVVDPLVVQIEVVLEGEQLERQLRLRIARFLFGFDQVVDRELVLADANRIIGRHMALGQHGQQLTQVPLQPDAVLGPQLALAA